MASGKVIHIFHKGGLTRGNTPRRGSGRLLSGGGEEMCQQEEPLQDLAREKARTSLRAEGLHKKWCAGQDLNLQGRCVATSTSSWRVCQFHHPRNLLDIK